MLQRAASNAYSWWWASHIRTKQSKWLEQNLQDMEEKVKATLNLLQDDGDSFAKRAEMYYRKRPELINFVDETFRAYKSLAERYNHISGELQNANTTIATVFPEQVQFAMEDDDEDGCSPRVPRQTYDPTKLVKEPPEPPKPNIPKVPKIPKKDVKGLLTLPTKRVQAKSTTSTPTAVTNSRITKTEALELIDKLQKGILALQTEKEFVKGSYESSLAKYCEIEKRIGEMQDEVCGLQDEFSVNTFIEDDEARSLMATTALKSCQESLVQLLEKQEKSAEESRVEHQRIKEAKEKFENLKRGFLPNQTDQPKMPEKEGSTAADSSLKSLEEEVEISKQERVELESIREKIKEHFETDADSSLTVTELAERIDELVTKVISLESAVSSQTALMKRLRSETTELHTNLHQLEEDKSTLIKDSNVLTEKLRKLEVGLNGVQDLNKNIEDQNKNLQTHFTEARCNLDHLTEKLQNVKQHEEDDEEEEEEEDKEVETTTTDSFQTEVTIPLDVISSLNVESHNQLVEVENMATLNDNSVKTEAGITEKEKVGSVSHDVNDQENSHRRFTGQVDLDVLSKKLIEPNELNAAENSSQTGDSDVDVESREEENNQDLPIDWQKLLLNGLEDREKILLTEYTSILRNYKDAKKKLTEVEKKNREGLFERLVQIRELKNANDSKDEEIRSLRQKLSVLQTSFEGNVDTLVADSEGSQNNRSHDGAEEGSTSRYSVNSDHQADRNVEATRRPEESAKIKTAEEQEESEMILADEPHIVSTMEEKFRKEIDELLEENLEFWLRFSTSFHQIQKFQTSIHDLQTEISKLKEKKKQEGNSSSSSHGFRALKSDARPIYKHLGEIQTELTVWLEKSAVLKEELQCRFSSLCDIQEEISKVLKMPSNTNAIADSELTRVQAAKFQGEVLNMKQENNKVADELQAGLDHVNSLHLEIEKTLSKLNDDYKLSGSIKSQPGKHGPGGKPRIPLRSFLFGSRPNKKKPSIFLCINPALHKHHHSNDLADGLPI